MLNRASAQYELTSFIKTDLSTIKANKPILVKERMTVGLLKTINLKTHSLQPLEAQPLEAQPPGSNV